MWPQFVQCQCVCQLLFKQIPHQNHLVKFNEILMLRICLVDLNKVWSNYSPGSKLALLHGVIYFSFMYNVRTNISISQMPWRLNLVYIYICYETLSCGSHPILFKLNPRGLICPHLRAHAFSLLYPRTTKL
jgi:hypothetical protein